MLIDTHCHLADLSKPELETILKNANKNDVKKIIAIGSGYGFDENARTLRIANNHQNIFCALAMHPHDAAQMTEENFVELSHMIATNEKVVGIGETGLDYHYMHSPKNVQQGVFNCFIAMAGSLKKPLIIHDRECGDDCVQIIKESGQKNLRGVVHCFSGNKDLAKKYLDLGFMISFTGIITFPKANELREIVKIVPMDRIMLETDAPFLAPVPYRGKKNEPAYVKHVAECVAEVKDMSFEDVAQATTKNAERFFGLPS